MLKAERLQIRHEDDLKLQNQLYLEQDEGQGGQEVFWAASNTCDGARPDIVHDDFYQAVLQ